MSERPNFSAATNKYAYEQIFSRPELQHRRPSLLVLLRERIARRRRPQPPAADSGPVDLVP